MADSSKEFTNSLHQKAPDRILQYSDYSVQSLGSLKRSVDDFFGSKMFSPFDHGWMQWSEVNLTYKSQPSASTSCSQAKDSGVNGADGHQTFRYNQW